MEIARAELEDVAELLLGDEGSLRTGPDVDSSILATPGDGAVGFQMDMLDARGGIGPFMDGIGGLETFGDAADLAVDVDIYIALLGAAILVEERRARLHRRLGVEDRRQNLIRYVQQSAGGLRGSLGLGYDRSDSLADEAHHVVENVGIVRIDEMIGVKCRTVEPARHVLPGEDLDHARHCHGCRAFNTEDAGMGMGRAQNF